MLILDWILIVIAIIITSIQTYRSAKDVDLLLFEVIALLISSSLSVRYHAKLANRINISPVITLLFLFIISSIILLIIAGIIAKYAQFSLAPINTWLGFILGFITSWVVLFILLKIITGAFPNGLTLNLFYSKKPVMIFDAIENSPVAKEILNFNSYKAVANFLNRLKLSE